MKNRKIKIRGVKEKVPQEEIGGNTNEMGNIFKMAYMVNKEKKNEETTWNIICLCDNGGESLGDVSEKREHEEEEAQEEQR